MNYALKPAPDTPDSEVTLSGRCRAGRSYSHNRELGVTARQARHFSVNIYSQREMKNRIGFTPTVALFSPLKIFCMLSENCRAVGRRGVISQWLYKFGPPDTCRAQLGFRPTGSGRARQRARAGFSGRQRQFGGCPPRASAFTTRCRSGSDL